MASRRTVRHRWVTTLAGLALVAGMAALGSLPANAGPAPAAGAPTVDTSAIGAPGDVLPAAIGPVAAAPPLHCVGNGTDGNRVQVVYAFEQGTPNLLSQWESRIRVAAWVAQQNVNDSAGREGAQRWLRFVSSSTGCQLTIQTVQVPAGTSSAIGDFVSWRNALIAAGLNAGNRIYAVYAENNTTDCAYTDTNLAEDNSPGTSNTHNLNPAWMTFNPRCAINGQALVHEFAHAAGAMSSAMPHSNPTDGAHCSDGIEALCGADAPTVVCTDPLDARLLDCGRDDYFAINPQGSFLPTHWNVAFDSLYLTADSSQPTQTVPPALSPQLLNAVDVEGTSIFFSWYSTMEPQSTGWSVQYQVLRDGSVVATSSTQTARVTGLSKNTSASYAVRTQFTFGGVTRTSANSSALTVTTNNSDQLAGGAADGAIMFLANDLTAPNGQPMVMDLFNFDTSDGAVIKEWDQTSVDNQQWKMTAAAGGTFTLTNQFSGKCVSTAGGATTAGTAIVSFTCNGSAAQRWTFSVISGTTYQIRTSAGTCIGAEDNGTDVGTDLVLATCSTSEPTQRWTTNRLA